MSTNQGEFKGTHGSEHFQDAPWEHKGGFYNIIVNSRNILVHQALERTIQHFSINGSGIRIFCADDLIEARKIAENNADIILAVIDNDVQVNGSYAAFLDYLKHTLHNRNCCVAFKEIGMQNYSCEKDVRFIGNENYEKFFNARERLIDITRMVMMTTEMENKIAAPEEPSAQENTFTSDEIGESDTWLTKEKLNTVMAHDLREPLGNIKVMLDFLTNEPELLDQETSKDLLNRVRESANSIHELLEDYLFWSRMFKQEIYFNPGKLDMGQVVRENLLLLKSTAGAKNISLVTEVPEGTHVFADEYMITTVVRNLLYNAIKFTPAGGSVTVTGKTADSGVVVEVRDNGVGNPREDMEKLVRTDVYLTTNGTAEESGSGLGLVLCKDFIEKNGGTIRLKSEERKGSTFIFTLPAWSFAELT